MSHSLVRALLAGLLVFLGWSFVLCAEEDESPTAAIEAPAGQGGGNGAAGGAPAKPKYPPPADVLGDAEPVNGLIRLHKKESRLFAELAPQQLNRDFIVLISIARGIGEGQLLGGMSWNFGDDWLWQFRKVDDQIFIVRRNVRFTAARGSPEERAVGLAYTDSVLFNLPIASMTPTGNYLVDFTPVFMSDLPQISRLLGGFFFASNKSTFAEVKGFPENVELEVAATYASAGGQELDTVPDSRGVTINVHYSISMLPQTGFVPRLADDRIGYFLTAIKDYSKGGNEENFVRYINRWDLRKKDPSSEISPPEKPIVFYLERTIPVKYRKAIRDGILEWNKAYEKAGFYDAIQVIQQEDNADWDPEDIRYNTFRWITSSAGFAMGPSRVNPLTGQILDADIIFDSDFIRFWKMEYENYNMKDIAGMTGGSLDGTDDDVARHMFAPRGRVCCDLHTGMSRELALGAAAFAIQAGAAGKPMEEKMILQGLKEVTMHEVGHTLGLRHNFKASSAYSLADLNNPEFTKNNGLTASVMDYAPVYLAPPGTPQGDFYSQTLGPYDMWAIEYGYKPLANNTEGDVAELKKIAARCAEAGLTFATDEDTRATDSDPLSYRFDLGNDAVAYAKQRVAIITPLWNGLVERVTPEGEGYQRARQAFGVLLSNYGTAMFMASRNIGGVYVHRDHRGDPNARVPFVVVPADKQREALGLLEEQVFSDKPFQFPPELYNHLASSRWSHWGTPDVSRLDYKVHEVILLWQERMLSQMLSSTTLHRLHDSELKVAADADAFTTAELMERLTKSIWSELDGLNQLGPFTNRKPGISSLRRNLQRSYLKRLGTIAVGSPSIPEDCQSLAYAELTSLEGRINAVLQGPAQLDGYTRSHLQESAARIRKIVDSRLSISAP